MQLDTLILASKIVSTLVLSVIALVVIDSVPFPIKTSPSLKVVVPVPPYSTPIVVPFQIPVLIVPKVFILELPV